ncbi:geranylgeranyl reductase family protein [Roseicitreum antarcticum]|uniref:Geranylgeranyl reductase family n=1 Tax=Roseicitreum antarcticum TaxID=564137 RepID=A0A1H2RYG0_9RHOB|nr:geranylgeranyl reductase family protein [Roseicitreum antarcticum]SDW23649.1 geranylgeranyl reductase family [Roseicitreum antarcticum]
MIKKFDILVVGSGPAGSAAAFTAASAGLSVALIDKAAFPRDKLCGGGITGRCASALSQVFGQEITPDLFLTSQRVRLFSQGALLADVRDAPPIHMTMRRDFDAVLHAQAKAAGAQVFAPARIADLDPATGVARLGDGQILQGQLIVGADGANSIVARALYGKAQRYRDVAFGLEVELPRDTVDGDMVDIDIGAVAWGYGWVFPKRGSVTVGVCGTHVRNPDMRAVLDRYANQGPAMVRALSSAQCKGAFLPTGWRLGAPGEGRVLLVGDAAGLVDPLTGEGIGWAIRSGELAAQASIRALGAGAPGAAIRHYAAEIRYVQDEIRIAGRIARLAYTRALRPIFARTVRDNPKMTRNALRLLAGQFDYQDFGLAFAGRITRRMGRAVLAR